MSSNPLKQYLTHFFAVVIKKGDREIRWGRLLNSAAAVAFAVSPANGVVMVVGNNG